MARLALALAGGHYDRTRPPSDWTRRIERAGHREKIALNPPSALKLEAAPEGSTLAGLLAAGAIDAVISPRAPSCHDQGAAEVGWLFDDPVAAARDYYSRTRIFPIMHLV